MTSTAAEIPHGAGGRRLFSGLDRRFWLAIGVAVGITVWAGIAMLTVGLLAEQPAKAGFDLELLLQAGRRVASGLGPYDPAALAHPLHAPDLFYSYPPPVAQLLSLVASIPSGAVLAAWGIGSVAGLAFVADRLRAILAPARSRAQVLIPVLAMAPLVYPYSVALIFGNADAWFPLTYGLLLLAVLGAGRATVAAAGIALGAAALAKLHPASLFLWLVVRGLGERRPRAVLAVALASAAAIVAISLLAYGPAPWSAYLEVVRAGAEARVVTPLNVGPGSQLALLLGNGEAFARAVAIAVALLALVLSAVVAAVRRDPVESLAWAALLSLVTLPVTWYHYPVALMPFAIAAWLRSRPEARRSVSWLLAASIVTSAGAILAPVCVWLAIALVIAAVMRSAPTEAGGVTLSPAAAPS